MLSLHHSQKTRELSRFWKRCSFTRDWAWTPRLSADWSCCLLAVCRGSFGLWSLKTTSQVWEQSHWSKDSLILWKRATFHLFNSFASFHQQITQPTPPPQPPPNPHPDVTSSLLENKKKHFSIIVADGQLSCFALSWLRSWSRLNQSDAAGSMVVHMLKVSPIRSLDLKLVRSLKSPFTLWFRPHERPHKLFVHILSNFSVKHGVWEENRQFLPREETKVRSEFSLEPQPDVSERSFIVQNFLSFLGFNIPEIRHRSDVWILSKVFG